MVITFDLRNLFDPRKSNTNPTRGRLWGPVRFAPWHSKFNTWPLRLAIMLNPADGWAGWQFSVIFDIFPQTPWSLRPVVSVHERYKQHSRSKPNSSLYLHPTYAARQICSWVVTCKPTTTECGEWPLPNS